MLPTMVYGRRSAYLTACVSVATWFLQGCDKDCPQCPPPTTTVVHEGDKHVTRDEPATRDEPPIAFLTTCFVNEQLGHIFFGSVQLSGLDTRQLHPVINRTIVVKFDCGEGNGECRGASIYLDEFGTPVNPAHTNWSTNQKGTWHTIQWTGVQSLIGRPTTKQEAREFIRRTLDDNEGDNKWVPHRDLLREFRANVEQDFVEFEAGAVLKVYLTVSHAVFLMDTSHHRVVVLGVSGAGFLRGVIDCPRGGSSTSLPPTHRSG